MSAVFETGAYTTVTGQRQSDVNVADGGNGLVGLDTARTVRPRPRSRLVTITNNHTTSLTFTVSLVDCGSGTLQHAPTSQQGCSVSFTLAAGGTGTVHVDPRRGNARMKYVIEARGSDFAFQATRETRVVGRPGAVRILNLNVFRVDAEDDEWTLKKAHAKDADKDRDLDHVEYRIVDESGAVVATETRSASGKHYRATGLTFTPDAGHDVTVGVEYTLTFTAFDVDGNSASESITAEAEPGEGDGDGGKEEPGEDGNDD